MDFLLNLLIDLIQVYRAPSPAARRKRVMARGQLIARSVQGDRVEEVEDQLWLVKANGEREPVTDEWLDRAFKRGGWLDVYEVGTESAFPSHEERLETIRTQPREDEGIVIAHSVRGDRVEELGGELWLLNSDGEREQVTDEWLAEAFVGGGWRDVRDVYEEVMEAPAPIPEEKRRVIARSVQGDKVEEVRGQLWLVEADGYRERVTDEWLEAALEDTSWQVEAEEISLGSRMEEGRIIAWSIHGERVEEVGDELWLMKPDGSREQVTDEWLDQAFKSGGWGDVYEGEAPVEMSQPIGEEMEEPGMRQPIEGEIKTEIPAQRAIHEPWETEIASALSFHDRVTPDMISKVPQDKRAFALQEYARLHPDEAYWDGQALVWKGKKKDEPESRG